MCYQDALQKNLLVPCSDEQKLHTWVFGFTGLTVPRRAICPGHSAPFDYLRHAYFEPAGDLIVWAPRSGGKTRLGAVATLLDLLHKPPTAVRILGGSLAQSLRMWEELRPDVAKLVEPLIDANGTTSKTIRLKTGASAAVLTQSQRAVRGLHVQKLRCDEVELFDPEVWAAAQLATKSGPWNEPRVDEDGLPKRLRYPVDPIRKSETVSASIEAISTLHSPFGLMGRIVDEAPARGTRVIRWCVLEVLEPCPKERECATCPLWEDCKGVAKLKDPERDGGYLSIDDAIRFKQRVSVEMWQAEMLCRRPSVADCVFPTFDRATHVIDEADEPIVERIEPTLAVDFGFHNPFVCLWVLTDRQDRTLVIDEYVQSGRTIEQHAREIRSRDARRGRARRISCDPAGNSPNEQTAESNIAYLRRNGFTVKTRGSRIQEGLEMIRARLRPGHGPAWLFVNERCTRLIKSLQAYHYPPGGGELPVKDGEHDHLIDALRYHFVNHRVQEMRSVGY